MTTYGAYDAGLPCKNPSCKSHGRPHPNCKCYPGLAGGGEVGPFCSKDRAHNPDCEYFPDGGVVGDFDSLPDESIPPSFDDLPDEGSSIQSDDNSDLSPAELQAKMIQANNPDSTPEPLKFDDLPDDQDASANEKLSPVNLQSQFIAAANPNDTSSTNKYETPGQEALNAAEHFTRGFVGFGPLVSGAEEGLSTLGVPGLSAADQAGRESTYPIGSAAAEIAGAGASMYTGLGEIGLISNALKVAPEASAMMKLGSSILTGAFTSGAMASNDETTKMVLGQNDPNDTIGAMLAKSGANVLMATGLGAALGPLSLVGKPSSNAIAEATAEGNLGKYANSVLYGMGFAGKNSTPELRQAATKALAGEIPGGSKTGFKFGQAIFDDVIGGAYSKLAVGAGGAGIGALRGYKEGGIDGALKGAKEGAQYAALASIVAPAIGKVSQKVLGPLFIKAASSGSMQGFCSAAGSMADAVGGSSLLKNGIEGLFSSAPAVSEQAVRMIESNKGKLDKMLREGGIDTGVQQQIYQDNQQPQIPGYAEGGEVKIPPPPILQQTNGLEKHYPEQNIILNAAKGRISNYLRSLIPPENAPRLAFDDMPDNKEQQNSYDKALGIAVNPTSVLSEIHKGTIEPEHVKHFNSMFPETSNLLQKKLTERIVQSQLDGEKPNWKIRQGLSLLMGTPLSGEFTPAGIQAAQSVYAPPQSNPEAQPGQAMKKKKSTAPLTNSDKAYLTPDQARQSRQAES